MTSEIGRRRAAALDENAPAYRERRRKIVLAAAEVFKRKGYTSTSLSDIARVAETDRATLYYYVHGKAELFDEVVSEAVEANMRRVEEVRAGTEPAPVKLRTLIVSLMESYAEHYPFLYVFIQENLSQVAGERAEWAQRMRRTNRRYEDAVIAIIREGIAEGTLRDVGEPWIVAWGLLGMLNATNRWFHPGTSSASATEIGEVFAETFLAGVIH